MYWPADVQRAEKSYLHKKLLNSNFFINQLFSMKKRFKIKRKEEFQKIIKARKRLVGKGFIVYYSQPLNVSNDRVGISVSKKLGNAVVRNRIKRQVRMMVGEITDFHNGLDVIIIVRNDYLTRSFDENKKELLKLYESVYNIFAAEK